MNEQQLKEKVKASLLIPEDIKQNLLNSDWNEQVIKKIAEYFEKYWTKEDKVIQIFNENLTSVAVHTIYEIEWENKKQVDQPRIKKIEEEEFPIVYKD